MYQTVRASIINANRIYNGRNAHIDKAMEKKYIAGTDELGMS